MSLVAALASAAIMAGPPAATLANAPGEPTAPVRCPPAPYYVSDRSELPSAVSRIADPRPPRPCYLVRGGRAVSTPFGRRI